MNPVREADGTEPFSSSAEQQPSPSASSTASGNTSSKRGPRTANACEQCKRRKTKCSGRPPPCEACSKATYACHFDDTTEASESRLKVKSSKDDDQVQHLLNGLLNSIKHNEVHVFDELVQALRRDGSPADIVRHFLQNLDALKRRGIINSEVIDEAGLLQLVTRLAVAQGPGASTVTSGSGTSRYTASSESASTNRLSHPLPGSLSPSRSSAIRAHDFALATDTIYEEPSQMQTHSNRMLPDRMSTRPSQPNPSMATRGFDPSPRNLPTTHMDYYQRPDNDMDTDGELTPRGGNDFTLSSQVDDIAAQQNERQGASNLNLDFYPVSHHPWSASQGVPSQPYGLAPQAQSGYSAGYLQHNDLNPTLTDRPWLQAFQSGQPLHGGDNSTYSAYSEQMRGSHTQHPQQPQQYGGIQGFPTDRSSPSLYQPHFISQGGGYPYADPVSQRPQASPVSRANPPSRSTSGRYTTQYPNIPKTEPGAG